ncbi:hypothetical protein BDB00DRAFT_827038 [Zychaea mexicana]|uniref:uncharacterized protein n=1 Tax=Zychaea mexicana TaxID=64656 RepID=UPI0022FDBFF6|nr:uncharacterized protein BDB00DRAFT_827038 [Zychaea mexicana]KAI9492744.1 hypothetical protein BDB00DRAFT_827038 [Zychaea mexicana]
MFLKIFFFFLFHNCRHTMLLGITSSLPFNFSFRASHVSGLPKVCSECAGLRVGRLWICCAWRADMSMPSGPKP